MVATVKWKQIPGEKSGYEVSITGEVRSYRTRQGHPANEPRLLTPVPIAGYMHVSLGRGKLFKVHRLVMRAFVGPCPVNQQVRHVDGNKKNNNLDNLKYGTAAQNYADRVRHGTYNDGERNGRAKLSVDDVNEIRISNLTTKELAAKFGVSLVSISSILSGKTWKHLSNCPEKVPGRPKGTRNPNSKLTENDVTYIRSSHESVKQLSVTFGVCTSTIYYVRSGQTWSHL